MAEERNRLRNADDVAVEWLLRPEDERSADEARDFGRWLAADPSHAEAWSQACRMWAEFDHAPDPLLTSILHSARSMRRPAWRHTSFQGAAVAASLLICAGMLTLVTPSVTRRHGEIAAVSSMSTIYATALKRSSVKLSDGSRIDLDARTRIAVDLTADRRNVVLLAGRAFFKVAHDTSKPFVVAAGGRTVTDVGTAFSVSLAQSTMEVVLASGVVTIANGRAGAPVRLIPGDRFTADGSGDGRIELTDVGSSLAWRTGYVELRNATISEAIEQMNRYSPNPVVVADDGAGALRVTGRFRTDDPIRFAKTLTEMYPVRIARGPGGATRIVLASGNDR